MAEKAAVREATSSLGPVGLEDPEVVTTVLLPAYNEAEALPAVLTELGSVLDPSSEVLVVDDGSTDRTPAIAAEHGCRVVSLPANRGKGVAVRTGIANARGRYVVIMDADGSYPAAAVPEMVHLLGENDVVRGVRQVGGDTMPRVNRVGNRIFDRLLSTLHGLEGGDQLSGLYGIRRQAFLDLAVESEGFDLEVEIWIKARARHLRVAGLPVDYRTRVGEKKLRPLVDGFRILSRMVTLLLVYNPLRMFVVPGLAMLVVSLTGAVVLSQGRVDTPYFGLADHSFIVAAVGTAVSFQLVIFGVGAALYGVEVGYQPAGWLRRVASRRFRLGAVLVGVGLFLAGAVWVAVLVVRWISGGAGDFTDTRGLVLACTFLLLGLELVFAALFLSIFAGRLGRTQAPPAHTGPSA